MERKRELVCSADLSKISDIIELAKRLSGKKVIVGARPIKKGHMTAGYVGIVKTLDASNVEEVVIVTEKISPTDFEAAEEIRFWVRTLLRNLLEIGRYLKIPDKK